MGNDIIDGTRSEEELRKALQAAQASKTQYEQAVSMISDIFWRYDVNAKGEHVGSYISPFADKMLGLPVGTIGNSFEKYFFLMSISMTCLPRRRYFSKVCSGSRADRS